MFDRVFASGVGYCLSRTGIRLRHKFARLLAGKFMADSGVDLNRSQRSCRVRKQVDFGSVTHRNRHGLPAGTKCRGNPFVSVICD
jgi:hypothetical protein